MLQILHLLLSSFASLQDSLRFDQFLNLLSFTHLFKGLIEASETVAFYINFSLSLLLSFLLLFAVFLKRFLNFRKLNRQFYGSLNCLFHYAIYALFSILLIPIIEVSFLPLCKALNQGSSSPELFYPNLFFGGANLCLMASIYLNLY